MHKFRVDVEDVFNNANERSNWNRPSLRDIEFYRDGKKVEIPEKDIEDFEFLGLNNEHFILDYEWPEEDIY